MSNGINNKNSNYINIFNRLQKKYSLYEGLLIIRRQYLTNNIFYYILCIIFRFIFFLSISGDYTSNFSLRKSKTFQSFLKNLNCHYLFNIINISFRIYCFSVLFILLLVIIKIMINIYNLKKFRKYRHSGKWPIPNKFQIILGHINFLFFPFIIEYLSFSYYIYFFPDEFIIKLNSSTEKYILIFFIILNTVLIIIYNIDNYIWIYCSNKFFTVTSFETNVGKKEIINTHNPISFRCSTFGYYIIIAMQNIILIIHIKDYIKSFSYKIIFVIINSLLLFFNILIFFINKINQFNYINYINTFVNVLFLWCFYSIILDLILFFIRYRNTSIINEVIYLLIKIILGFITYILFVLKTRKFLESKILEILFQEKNRKKEKFFVNSFYHLHEIMFLIKEKDLIESAHALFQLLNKHIDNCHKINCNCKFFDAFEGKKFNNNETNIDDEPDIFMTEFLNILNYLFESTFIDNNFYNNYDLTIILAEHFCHLKDNPTMSFSLITSLILKKRNHFSFFEMANLYELSQKYIYYIKFNSEKNILAELYQNKMELLKNNMQEELFQSYYHNLIYSNKIKAVMNNYIDNIIKILTYKNIFEDSISYQLDESNENIISAKIKFFEQNNQIENLYNNYSHKKFENNKLSKTKNDKISNLYIIIYLLKKEKLFYKELINSVDKIEITKSLPIVVIFKYFIFFDIFGGGKIPEEISKKLFYCIDNNNSNLYNTTITRDEFAILKRRYKEQNNRIGSKIYVIVEFRKELRTKYFTEDGALKLGYKQKDIKNEKIDILMPSKFCKSHQNAIKQLIIGSQVKYSISKQSYYFYKGSSFLYSANFEGALIYSLSKTLLMMLESYLNYENEYRFMLNNNFELMASSRNFEYEYHLNKRLFELFNINFLEIIKMKPEKLKKNFDNEYKKMAYLKLVQQIKTNDYLIPELYLPPGDKIYSVVKYNNFYNSKDNVLSSILNKHIKENDNDYENKDNQNEYEKEKKRLISREKITDSIKEYFISPREVVFHKTYNAVINKANFIENLYREIMKISENDIKIENDKLFYNLILSAKKLISKLILKKSEFKNNFIKISIKFSFYYDKPFYFVTINDEKKLYIKPYNKFYLENNVFKEKSIEIKNTIPNNKSRNKNIINKKASINKDNKEHKEESNNYKNKSNYQYNYYKKIRESENKDALNIINKNKKYINKAKFIKIIKFILSIIIILIIIIYIIIIIYQKSLTKKVQLILLSYYYSLFTKNLLLGVYSVLLNLYYDFYILGSPGYTMDYYILTSLTNTMKEIYHNYTIYFYSSNSAIDHDVNIIFNQKNFTKLRGYWQEIPYESKYSSELDFIIYNILSSNSSQINTKENIKDFENFLFLKGIRNEIKEKVNYVFVKLLYYICVNHEFVYKEIFKEIEDSIHEAYENYVDEKTRSILISEIFGIILYIIFFIIVFFYLYFSNNIIIKNIIFLFSDYNEENNDDDKTKINNTNKINLKLVEFQNLLNDFNMNLLDKFSKNIENINKNKYIANAINKQNSNKSINTISENVNQEQNSNTKRNTNRNDNSKGVNKRGTSSKNLIDEIINKNKGNNKSNNSSVNYLMESKDNINNNSINGSKEILSFKSNDNINNKNNNISKPNLKNNILTNNKDEDQLNVQEILLNNSNKSFVLMIKIYFIIIALLLILVIVFISIKLNFIMTRNKKYNRFFSDMDILTDRYMQVCYYFNVLRTLLIFPEGEMKKKFESILENINSNFDEENNKFNKLLTENLEDYPKVSKLINIMRINKNNSTNILINNICIDSPECSQYLYSSYNIFDSGLELGLTTSISEIHNIFMNYQNLNNNNMNIGIIRTIIGLSKDKFISLMLSLNYFYVYVEQYILFAFEEDERNFNISYINTSTILNIICIIFSIFTFIFVIIFIFISISNFTEPIKDSTYRINCSFYYIKKYNMIT